MSVHTHTIVVLETDLSAPPADGATFQSTIALGHTHTVTLTDAELTMIAGGGSVTVLSSMGEQCQAAHAFKIMKA
jgi:hypothetical protein